MRIVLTGATSFIGRAVLNELLAGGHQVFAVVRPGSPGREALEQAAKARGLLAGEQETRDPSAREQEACGPLAGGQETRGPLAPATSASLKILPCPLSDIHAIIAHPALAGGADAWMHLGWEGAGSANRADETVQRRNIGYALESLRTAAALGCRRFCFSGSQAEYGICDGPMHEELACRPVSEYGKDKLKVCEQALELAKELGITYIHTRIFSVYGPGDHPWSLVETCLDAFLSGGHIDLGACTQQWNFMYVTDAARALAELLLGNAESGVYNVAGEDTRPLSSYIEELHRLCGGGGTFAYGKRPPNAEGVVSLRPETGKLKAAVGWRCRVDFETGIRTMIDMRKMNRR